MTQRGLITSITRHGINRIETGPLRRCSFEETVEILLEAAAYGETDYLRGVSENIIMGQLAPMGTGCFDLMLDKEILKREAISRNLKDENDPFEYQITKNETDEDYENTPHPHYTPDYNMNPDDGATEVYSEWARNAYMTPIPGDVNYETDNLRRMKNTHISSPAYSGSPAYEVRTPIYKNSKNESAGSMYGSAFHSKNPGSVSSPNYSPTYHGGAAGGYSPGGALSPYYASSPSYKIGQLNSSVHSPNAMGQYLGDSMGKGPGQGYAHASPQYSPTTSNNYLVASPSYSPTTPAYQSGISPRYSAGGGKFADSQASPSSPIYNPSTPAYGSGGYSAAKVKVEVKKETEEEKEPDHAAPQHYKPFVPDDE